VGAFVGVLWVRLWVFLTILFQTITRHGKDRGKAENIENTNKKGLFR
jgi:hypothetical protein